VLNAQGSLSSYNFNSGYSQAELKNSLNEISGLTFLADKLFTHNDESATIFQIDEYNGKIIKKFTVGNPAVKGDFEDIAAVQGKLYLISSIGDIYMFSEGGNKGNVGYKVFSTGITKSDIEGLCYDEATNSLLIACKGNPGKHYKGHKVIYSFDLNTNTISSEPRFKLNLSDLRNKYGLSDFSPSAIIKNKKTGTFFILSSRDKAVAEMTASGKIINLVKLDEYRHNQPEGIEFAPDGSLLISDEGGSGRGTLTRYSMKK